MIELNFITLNFLKFRQLALIHICLQVLPRIQKHEILLFAQTDARLANNGLPEELQKLRCRVNYKALRFTQPIEETGRRIVTVLREKGPFLVLRQGMRRMYRHLPVALKV